MVVRLRSRQSHCRQWAARAPLRRDCIGVVVLGFVLFSVLSLARAGSSFDEAARAYENAEIDKALAILEPLAARGNPQAQSLLGVIYYNGVFLDTDLAKARELFEKAARGGDPEAQYKLGFMYLEGVGVKPDPQLARFWLRKSAEQGNPSSQFYLGLLHLRRLAGKPPDLTQAKHWLAKAAQQGHKLAESFLLQADLLVGQPTHAKAWATLRKLKAIQREGLAPVQYTLGILYQKGWGVTADASEALKWLTLAAYQGLPEAISAREKLVARMNETQKNTVEQAAVEWLIAASLVADSYIGRASQWCHKNKPRSLECLKLAPVHHNACIAPYFPGKFRNFASSIAYAVCREKRLRDAHKTVTREATL